MWGRGAMEISGFLVKKSLNFLGSCGVILEERSKEREYGLTLLFLKKRESGLYG
jgi:hypothetical protein